MIHLPGNPSHERFDWPALEESMPYQGIDCCDHTEQCGREKRDYKALTT